MKHDIPYRQPRWVNAIVIAGCVPAIPILYVMPKGFSQALALLAVLLPLLLFVAICNKVRSGAFFPRWSERKWKADQLKSEKGL